MFSNGVLRHFGETSLKFWVVLQGGVDVDTDRREKGDAQDKTSPFEEDKSPEMKVGEESDANGRGLLNGMDRDCKDFKYGPFLVVVGG